MQAVIFVQCRNDLPEHIWPVLRQTRALWPGPIYLVAPARQGGFTELQKLRVTFVPEEAFAEHALVKQYESASYLDTIHKGWNGFWDGACKRFAYIAALMERECIEESIYIENDVLPYVEIGRMFGQFHLYYGSSIVFTPHAPEQHSCCFLYIGSVDAVKRLATSCIDYQRNGPEWFREQCPTQEIINETSFAYLFEQQNTEIAQLFPNQPGESYVIDPMAYGQWEDGTIWNPGERWADKNQYVGADLLFGRLEVYWDVHDRMRPYVRYTETGTMAPIWAMHFHSKRPQLWM